MDYMARAFAEHEERYYYAVKNSTWGHLYPRLGVRYNGWVVFVVSAFRDVSLVDFEFDQGLESSEPLYEDILNFASYQYDVLELDPGLYRWKGWYHKYKNARCRFQSVPLERFMFT